ncbi:hypothetical protein CYMTET_35779 [Cymbomonas tetramitiformis]|uniref:Uncharacterized protein n=1 Tax=Cymbomonas tetramitiformis TaxID=36881 RepID=A0AAE0F8I6_9CHLO|nr:hypothetical protein CYMTET_35779 [Cymbomonas tetramitiformis]
MVWFEVNPAKYKGLVRVMEFLGVLLSTDGERFTASIDEERMRQVRDTPREVAAGPVRKQRRERLLGLLAFCSQVVWGSLLYTR